MVTVWYHMTWLVNSASHIWGGQPYETGDMSRNNALVGVLAFGEGWHHNHRARHPRARPTARLPNAPRRRHALALSRPL